MKDKILEALAQLDPLNDEHWTTDGAPRMDAIETLLGDTTVTRKDVVNAAPDFNREKAGEPKEEIEEDDQGETSKPAPNGDTGSAPQQTLNVVTKGQNVEVELPLDIELIDLRSLASELLTTTDIELLESQEESLKGLIEAAVRTRDQMVQSIVNIRGAISLVRQRIQQVRPAITNQEAIGSYIRAQTEARAEKVARRQKILQGLKLDDLDPRAPIDAAMARKTKRGTQRPVRPLLK